MTDPYQDAPIVVPLATPTVQQLAATVRPDAPLLTVRHQHGEHSPHDHTAQEYTDHQQPIVNELVIGREYGPVHLEGKEHNLFHCEHPDCQADALEASNQQMSVDPAFAPTITDVTAYGEKTLMKVREGLRKMLGSEQVITDCITEMQNQGILFRESPTDTADVVLPDGAAIVRDASGRGIVVGAPDVGEVSDGFHTFNELYAHRCALTAVLATIGAINGDSWKSTRHHPDDGPMFDGYFVVGIELPDGPISYHYPLKDWGKFAAVPELEVPPKWDGHTSADVVERLGGFVANLRQAIADGQVDRLSPEESAAARRAQEQPDGQQ